MTRYQLNLINTTLHNDETSTDNKIIEYFTSNGIDNQCAVYALTFRSMFGKDIAFHLYGDDFPCIYKPIR